MVVDILTPVPEVAVDELVVEDFWSRRNWLATCGRRWLRIGLAWRGRRRYRCSGRNGDGGDEQERDREDDDDGADVGGLGAGAETVGVGSS
ncbi:MAG: hypothetical protein H6512_14125 [Acidimicrobiia bacterium]|nr:hypothetical protein [Acidimicrobiia bacterium]